MYALGASLMDLLQSALHKPVGIISESARRVLMSTTGVTSHSRIRDPDLAFFCTWGSERNNFL